MPLSASISKVFLTHRHSSLPAGRASRYAGRSGPCGVRTGSGQSASVVLAEKAELAVGFALQAGQVKQQGRSLGGGLAFFADRGGLAAHGVGDRLWLRPGTTRGRPFFRRRSASFL